VIERAVANLKRRRRIVTQSPTVRNSDACNLRITGDPRRPPTRGLHRGNNDMASISTTAGVDKSLNAAYRRSDAAANAANIVAARGRRVIVLLLGLWIINAFDLALTLLATRDGVLYEENPIARALLAHSPYALAIFKVLTVTAASSVLIYYRRHRCSEWASALVATAYALVALQWKLCYEMYEITLTANVHWDDAAHIGRWSTTLGVF
jgi:hypothetical protein